MVRNLVFFILLINLNVLWVKVNANNDTNYLRQNSEFYKNIKFKIYDRYGYVAKNPEDCDNTEKFAILLHGWRESCEVNWMQSLVKHLNEYRGGCIICMDYSSYSELSYVRLVRLFKPIVNILTSKLNEMEYYGFDPNKGYMFGFSFGARVATAAGYRFGVQKLKEIDCCDMAGPGFDTRKQLDHKLAAQNVQCIQTSSDKGTRHNNCHQNWKLGNCGMSQSAAGDPPYGSHGLCPYFYNSAFNNNFEAILKPQNCNSKRSTVAKYPYKFTMGYKEWRKEDVEGVLYAETGSTYPFNVFDNINAVKISNFEYDWGDADSVEVDDSLY